MDESGFWWPDYPGNNLFNSLGNLAVNPEAALLFFHFTAGRTLHLSGTVPRSRATPRSATDVSLREDLSDD